MTAPRLNDGQVVAGKYTVRGALGFGGATATYQATNAAGQAVCVKMYSPSFGARQDLLGALQHAIGVTNALPQDTAVRVVDFGLDPALGAPYTVTELEALPSLARTVERGPLPMADVIALLRGLAKAVDAAHAQRLVHGALKPANLFVGPAPQRVVKVADFGVRAARVAAPTPEGFALAAPWIAPEQLQPGADAASVDVFAAALVAFYAATGRSFWRSCQGPVPDGQAWQQEVTAPRVGCSVRAREVGATLPPALDVVMSRALAVSPAERFKSVGELAEAFAARGGAGAKLGMTMPLNAQSPFAGVAPEKGPAVPRPAAAAAPAAPSPPVPAGDLGSTLALPSPNEAPQGLGGLPMLGVPEPEGEPETVVTRSPLNDFSGPGPAAGFAVAPGFAPAPAPAPAQQQQPAPAPMQAYPPAPGPQQAYSPAPAPPFASAAVPSPSYEERGAPPKKRTGLVIGISAGVLFLLLAGGAAVFFLVFRAAAPVAATPPPTPVTSVAAASTPATPPATPPATTSAAAATAVAPSDSAAATAEAADAATEEPPAEIVVTCTPACESLSVDGNDLQDLVDPVQLPAGTHTLVAGKPSYLSQTRKVTLKAGDKQTVTFTLIKPGPAAPPPPKPCPKFVQHCP